MFWSRQSAATPEYPAAYFQDRAAFRSYGSLWDDIARIDTMARIGIMQQHADDVTISTHVSEVDDMLPAQQAVAGLAASTKLGLASVRSTPLQIQICAESAGVNKATGDIFDRIIVAKETPLRGTIEEYILTPTSLVQTVSRMRKRQTRFNEQAIQQLRIDLHGQSWEPLDEKSAMFYR